MKVAVFKYELNLNKRIDIPSNSRVIKVAFQEEKLMCWALVNKDEIESDPKKTVFCLGTGTEIEGSLGFELEHIDTLFKDGLVYHIFADKF